MAKKKPIKKSPIQLEEKTESTAEGFQTIVETGAKTNRIQVGDSGTEIYGGYFDEEYLGELKNTRAADVYDKMRRSESQVAMLLGALYNPIKAATWEVQSADETNDISILHADFINHILFNTLEDGFDGFIHEALSCIPFGYSVFEVVHNVVFNHPKFGTFNGLAKLGFRTQKSIERWNLEKKTGKIISIEQMANGDVASNNKIPGDFCLVFTVNKEGDNYEGISALRPMYGAYKRKGLYLRLTAVGIEKYAYGILLGTVPAGKEKSDEFNSFVEHMRAYNANEKSFILRPQGWDIEIVKEAFDADKVVKLLQFENTEMINALIGNFLALGTGGNGGAYALGKDLSDFFLGGIQAYANLICEKINKKLIPNLIDLKYGPQENYPKLSCSGISDNAGKELADTISVLINSKSITPDERLEDYLRKLYKLPKMDATTQRKVEPAATNSFVPFGASEKTMKFSEDSKRYRKKWDENKLSIKELMQRGLKKISENMVDEIRRNWEKSNDNNFIKSASDLSLKGKAEYIRTMRDMLTEIAIEAMNEAKKEVPGTNVKLSEKIKTIQLGDFDKLPPFLKNLLTAAALNMESQVEDVAKIVKFQFGNSAVSTDDIAIISKDINDKVDNFLEGSTASGASIDAAAGNLVSNVTQQARKEVFFSDEVFNEIESFTFTNEDPVSPICQDLAGTTFAADDKEAERYFPPLHHNCKSRLVPNMKGDKNPGVNDTGLKPSKSSLEKYITLQENVKHRD